MPAPNVSRVAELLFHADPLSAYFKGISELQAVLSRVCGQQAVLKWSDPDVAMFDMPGIRILLSLTPSPYDGFASRLFISVGPSPILAPQDRAMIMHASFCLRIVNRLKEQCTPSEIRWNDVAGIVNAEAVHTLSEGQARGQRDIANPLTTPAKQDDTAVTLNRLHELRGALHPYGPTADLPAAWMRVANTSLDLAASLAVLPSAALRYAATWFR